MSKQQKISAFFRRGSGDTQTDSVPSSSVNVPTTPGTSASSSSSKTASSESRPTQQSLVPSYKTRESSVLQPSAACEKHQGRPRLIQTHWFQKFLWLTSENNVLYCKVCIQFRDISDPTSKLVTGYAPPCKVETLKFHDKSDKHKKATEANEAKNAPHLTPMGQAILKANSELVDQMCVHFSAAYYIAYHAKPFTDYEKQFELLKKLGVKVNEKYVNRTQCTNFVEIISTTIRDDMLNHIRNSPCVSVLLDGSTDVSNESCVVIYMRYLKKNELKESFLCLEPLASETAEGYYNALVEVFERYQLPYRKPGWLIGIGTDGAPSMMGEKGGLGKRVRDICPQLIQIHCVAHRLQLAVLDACSKVKFIGQCERNIRAIFKYYHDSPKKLRELRETAAVLEEKIVKLTDLNSVRWVASKKRTLEALLRNWCAVITHLENNSAGVKDASTTKGFLNFMLKYRYVKFCHFLLDFLIIFSPISEAFQKEMMSLTQVNHAVESGLLKLEKLLQEKGAMEEQFHRNFNADTFEFQNMKLEDVTMGEKAFNADREAIIRHAISYLKSRFSTEDSPILSSLKCFDTATWPTGRQLANFGDQEILTVARHFKTTVCCESGNEIPSETLLDEWYDLKQSTKDLSFFDMCHHAIINFNSTGRFKLLGRLMSTVLCLPVSTSSCERGFSCMNLIKTIHRSLLTPKSMSNLLNIRLNGETVTNFNPLHAVQHWFNTAKRRPH